jgi:23S rRNA pseudouridine955/2504/2580 synthase
MKKSETRYKRISGGLIEAGLEYSVTELELGTGRMHQIRKHLAMTGNPVLGDDKYGDFALNKKLRKTHGLKRLLLHASRLAIKGEYELDVTSPLPEYFREWGSGTGD